MTVVAVVGLRWIARGARAGAPSVLLWTLAAVVFFVPLAAAVVELSSRQPAQGGPYAWTRRAFGPFHGFVCGWCLWVNNLFYFPSLLLFAAANAALVAGASGAGLADSRLYNCVFVLGTLWILIALNILGLEAAKRLQNAGAVATWLPPAMLIGSAAIALALYGSETSFAPAELAPREDVWATLSLWSAMCFAFSGFEITSLVGQEVRDPARTIPRGVLIAGVLVAGIYMLGSASVLIVTPADSLAELSGISDAVDAASTRIGLGGLGVLTAALLAIGAVAGVSSWIAGAARVPFAAGVDHVLPSWFARLHPTRRTPHVSLVVQGAASSAIFLASLFISLAGGRTTIQEAYDIMVNLTILTYFVPYLYLFLAFVALRRRADREGEAPQTIRAPGNVQVIAGIGGCGFAATLISIGLVFIPPAGVENVLNYEANLAIQFAAVIGVGLLLYRRTTRSGGQVRPNHGARV
jgi:amino acid transporter